MLTESRSWFPKLNFVYAHGLCPVQRKNHRKNSWVVEKLKTVFEFLLRNKSLRRKTNWSVSVCILIRPAKYHSNKKNNIFMPILCIRVSTGCFAESRNSRVVSSVVEHSTAIRQVHSSHPGVPQFCREWIVRKCSPGTLMEKNQELTGRQKTGAGSTKKVQYTTKTERYRA